MNRKDPYRSLRRLVLACMILVPGIPFVAVLAIGYSHFTASLEASTIDAMERVVEDHRLMIESFLEERRADLTFIVDEYELDGLAWPRAIREVFQHLQKGSNAFVDLGVFNEDGLHMAYHGPFQLTGKNYREASWFQEVMKRGYYISDIFLGYRNVPHFVIAVVGEDPGGKWVLRATIDSNRFNELVKKVRIGRTGEAYLLNRNGLFQTERRSGGNLMEKDEETAGQLTPQPGIRTFIARGREDVEQLYATTWLQNQDWMLVVRQEKADAFEALHTASVVILLITLLGGSAIVGSAFYLTHRIVQRMAGIDREKDRLGDQLIRATRLAELGEMAAGFAHEINNPLQIMKSEQALIDTLLEELREKGDLKETEELVEVEDSMKQIGLQIERCSKITQAILKFGRQSEPVRKNLNLRAFIPEVAAMVEKKAGVNGISLEKDFAADLPEVYGDPAQLQQVLLNLFNNAMDAVSARHGGEGGHLFIGAGRTENGRVALTVRDNGVGIRPEDRDKIFRPFFTTKPVGKGTGLGLSVCYGIIHAMGGSMEVSSEPGKGTEFTILLPAAEKTGGIFESASRGERPGPGDRQKNHTTPR